MAKINLNSMAKVITLNEGGKENVSIAQVKEIIKLTLEYLADEWDDDNENEVINVIKKYSEKYN